MLKYHMYTIKRVSPCEEKEKEVLLENQEKSLIYGKNAVIEFLKSGKHADVVYLSDNDAPQSSYIAALAKQAGATVKHIHPLKLNSLCGSSKHQGVAAAVSVVEYADVETMFEVAGERGEAPFLIMADGINDPHNLGAIIRTAECAGAHGVIIPERGGCAVTPTVYMSSSGAAAHMAIARVVNLSAVIRDIKKQGVFVYCADMDGEYLCDVNLTGPICLVVGAEGSGVSRLVKELCDGVVSLPLLGRVDSLNASVAAGVVMYEILRQRKLIGGSNAGK